MADPYDVATLSSLDVLILVLVDNCNGLTTTDFVRG